MWTNPKHFSQWLPPTAMNMEFIHSDIRQGGNAFYSMGNGEMKMYGRVEYLKIDRPHLIQYTQQFCDEKENVTRHYRIKTWPETMLTTVQLVAEDADTTRVTVTWEPFGAVSKEELDTFVQAKGGMTEGWTGSFDKLEEKLKK
jgi:uncharacterized protein YndB with AHSA1/START domain